jgi:hypothetical protein
MPLPSLRQLDCPVPSLALPSPRLARRFWAVTPSLCPSFPPQPPPVRHSPPTFLSFTNNTTHSASRPPPVVPCVRPSLLFSPRSFAPHDSIITRLRPSTEHSRCCPPSSSIVTPTLLRQVVSEPVPSKLGRAFLCFKHATHCLSSQSPWLLAHPLWTSLSLLYPKSHPSSPAQRLSLIRRIKYHLVPGSRAGSVRCPQSVIGCLLLVLSASPFGRNADGYILVEHTANAQLASIGNHCHV